MTIEKGQEFHPVGSLYLSRVSSNPIESVVTIFSYKIAERDDKLLTFFDCHVQPLT
jgi:hypothetical protein